MPSQVCKIGDWNLNKKQEKGNENYAVVLATANIKLQTHTNLYINCRSVSDPGATISCIDKRFIEENRLQTTKCQKPILGISGPEILTRKLKAIIRPWFTSDYMFIVEFFCSKCVRWRISPN